MAYISQHTGTEIDESINKTQQLINLIYPIGSIYMNINNISPATFLGGTWEQIQDTFLMAAGTTYAAGTNGGTASVNFTPKGSNTGTALTVAQIPSHYHRQNLDYGNGYVRPSGDTTYTSSATENTTVTNGTFKCFTGTLSQVSASDSAPLYPIITGTTGSGSTHTHTFTGTSQTIPTLPPYLSVYIWKRIA